MSTDRYGNLTRRVYQRYAAGDADRHAFDNDPVFRAHIEMIRNMFIATEGALAAEGVDEETRNRVAYRLLYGEAPHSYPAPDSSEALSRMHAREERLRQLIGSPLLTTRPEGQL